VRQGWPLARQRLLLLRLLQLLRLRLRRLSSQDSQRLSTALFNVFVVALVTLVTLVVTALVKRVQPTAGFAVACSGVILAVLGVVLVLAVPSLRHRNLPADQVRLAVEETAAAQAGKGLARSEVDESHDSTHPEDDSRQKLLSRIAELEGELERQRRSRDDALAAA
jgi:hypothetical protein